MRILVGLSKPALDICLKKASLGGHARKKALQKKKRLDHASSALLTSGS